LSAFIEMINTIYRAHDEDVAGWILRPYFDLAKEGKILRNPANKDKTVRNLVDQGKNLICLTAR